MRQGRAVSHDSGVDQTGSSNPSLFFPAHLPRPQGFPKSFHLPPRTLQN